MCMELNPIATLSPAGLRQLLDPGNPRSSAFKGEHHFVSAQEEGRERSIVGGTYRLVGESATVLLKRIAE